jgi:hypothetical protein
MNKTINNLRLLLCTFSGEDNFIIKRCNNSIQFSFALIGAFVIAIFIGCFISAYYFFNSLFQNNFFISLPIGLTWALLVANMYLLLLYTVAPTTLPVKGNNSNKNNFLSVTMLFRISFMSLLAIIIAQPLNVLFLSNTVETSIKKHIQEEKTNMVIVADKFLIKNEIELLEDFNKKIELNCTNEESKQLKEILYPITQKINTDNLFLEKTFPIKHKLDSLKNKIWLVDNDKKTKDSLITKLTQLTNDEIESDLKFSDDIKNIQVNNPKLSNDFYLYKTNLNNAINKKIENYNKLDYLLSKSNFYIKKIQLLLFENPLSWIITIAVCFIFILPIYFKYKIRLKTGFYDYKIELEKKIINEEYIKFKKNYSKILHRNTVENNFKSLNELKKNLAKLKTIDSQKFKKIEAEIKEEYKEEVISKYEYWADSPFRTLKKFNKKTLAKEEDFLKIIYPEEN